MTTFFRAAVDEDKLLVTDEHDQLHEYYLPERHRQSLIQELQYYGPRIPYALAARLVDYAFALAGIRPNTQ